MKLVGQDEAMPLCDLITLDDDGLICRLDNCYDTTKCPQAVIDAGAPTLAAWTEEEE